MANFSGWHFGHGIKASSVAVGTVLALTTPSRAVDWTGITSNNWFTAGSWSGGVPTNATNATIDTITPNATVVGTAGAQAATVRVGVYATGALTIQAGGTVSSAFGVVGIFAGSTGAVTVDGAGSSWTSSGGIDIGNVGNGTLTVRNGAAVSASSVFLARNAGSIGTLNIGAAVGQAATAPGTLSAASVDLRIGSGQIVFNHTGTNYTFAPVIIGSGAGTRTVRVEAGTTILTAASTYRGPTIINGGTLSVNGSIASSAVTVNAGGALGGNGTVGSTTINGGRLAPGNSIGLLTVNGSLVFTAASSYMVEVSPANADRVNVTGTATLGGATVNAIFAAGTYVAKQYTILNATGGLGGSTFGSMVNTNLPQGFKSSLSYDVNNAYLNLALSFIAPPGSGLNGNQQAVGNALVNSFNRNGGIPLVFGGLTATGLSRISGESAVGSQQTTFDAMTQFMGAMSDPTTAGRGFDAGAGATAFAKDDRRMSADASPDNSRSKSERDAYAAIYRKTPIRDAYDPRWSAWSAGFGGSQTTEGNAALGSNTATSRVFGVVMGADYLLSPRTIAGFALAGGGTGFSIANGGSGRSDLFQAGAFIKHKVGAAYITAAAAYGWQDITTDRTLTIAGIDRLRANFNANAFSGRIEGGNRNVMPWMGGLGLTPYAAAQVTNFDLPAYAESALAGASSFALTYAARSVTAARGELGLRSDKSFAVNDAILTLRGRAAWAHDFNPNRSLAATFQTLPGASFVVSGAAPARDSALVTTAAEMKWLNGFTLAATFEGAFSDVTRSYAGKGVARYNW